MFLDDLLREVQEGCFWPIINILVGVSGTKEGLQKLIDVVHGYCGEGGERLKDNV